ncbi:MAG: hypothetical protein R2724_17200 [Bryobacterales bacterium]
MKLVFSKTVTGSGVMRTIASLPPDWPTMVAVNWTELGGLAASLTVMVAMCEAGTLAATVQVMLLRPTSFVETPMVGQVSEALSSTTVSEAPGSGRPFERFSTTRVSDPPALTVWPSPEMMKRPSKARGTT